MFYTGAVEDVSRRAQALLEGKGWDVRVAADGATGRFLTARRDGAVVRVNVGPCDEPGVATAAVAVNGTSACVGPDRVVGTVS